MIERIYFQNEIVMLAWAAIEDIYVFAFLRRHIE